MSRGEADLVKYFIRAAGLPKAKFPIGIGDDMAQVRLKGGQTVLITADMLLDGTHFDSGRVSLEKIGYKCMAASLSDCAAMATIALAAVVSVALPKNFGGSRLKKLHKGILIAAEKYNCPLIGGDMTGWDKKLAVNVAMLSVPAAGVKPVKRSGAKAGDLICITGELGGSIAKKHLEFKPRIQEALKIAKAGANAMLDISDGLSTDLNNICRMSKKGAVIEADKIPISRQAQKNSNPLKSALNDGEDFELLFTIPPKKFEKLKNSWNFKTRITAAGYITKDKKMRLKTADGKTVILKPAGYDHLKQAK